jgi:3-oxoacyl-[acyl-carrier protein] reductase
MTGRLTSLSRSIDGRRTVVTGAGSGMGRATAHLFADEGARVAVVDRDAAGVRRVLEEIEAVHGPGIAVAVVADLTELEEIKRVVDTAVEAFGGLDIVVNNAGVSMVTSMFSDEESFEAGWATTMAINLTAYARMVRHALPFLLRAPEGGRVVNIASTEAIVATGGIAAYSASKAGVTGLTRNMAVELGRHGVTVNCICPGPINTAMTSSIGDDAKAVYAKRRVPLRRYGEPEEVAHMTLNLCLPSSSFVNGASIPVDGGMVIRH